MEPIQLVRDPKYADAIVPVMAHDTDSGYDMFAAEDTVIQAFRPEIVPTGWLLGWLDPDYEIQVRPRSSQPLKLRCTVANSPGTIDAGYRGPIGVEIFYYGDNRIHDPIAQIEIKKGDKIGQMVVNRVYRPGIVVADKVTPSDRGAGGYGSTGNTSPKV